jgi:hypothetical protein
MAVSKTLDLEGVRYTVRGLIFEELIQLGRRGIEGKDDQTIVKEIAQCCLVDPKLNSKGINCLNGTTLSHLAHAILKLS